MIDNAIEAEVTPLACRNERVDGDFVIERGTQTDESRDDEVVVGGMVIVARTLGITPEPGSCLFVEIFAHIRTTAMMHRLGVEFKVLIEQRVRKEGCRQWIVVHYVGQGGKRLTGGEGPDGAVPFAGGASRPGMAEEGMTTFGSSHAVGSEEAFGVGELEPGGSILCGIVVSHPGVPGQVADQFAHLAERVELVAGAEELEIGIPEFFDGELAEMGGAFGKVLLGAIDGSPREHRGQGSVVSVHVAVDGGTAVLVEHALVCAVAATADALLHAVLYVALPPGVKGFVTPCSSLPNLASLATLHHRWFSSHHCISAKRSSLRSRIHSVLPTTLASCRRAKGTRLENLWNLSMGFPSL